MPKSCDKLSDQESVILKYLEQHRDIKNAQAKEILQVSATRAREVLVKLVKMGQIESHGRSNNNKMRKNSRRRP